MTKKQEQEFYRKFHRAVDAYQNKCVKEKLYVCAGLAEELRYTVEEDAENRLALHEYFKPTVTIVELERLVGYMVSYTGDSDVYLSIVREVSADSVRAVMQQYTRR